MKKDRTYLYEYSHTQNTLIIYVDGDRMSKMSI